MEGNPEERTHGSTVELHEPSALEILEDVQEILTKMIRPGMHANVNKEIWHEQTRTALNLVLKAITVLKRRKSKS